MALARNSHVIEAPGTRFERFADWMNPKDNDHLLPVYDTIHGPFPGHSDATGSLCHRQIYALHECRMISGSCYRDAKVRFILRAAHRQWSHECQFQQSLSMTNNSLVKNSLTC